MATIEKVIASPGFTGFYFDDQAAIKGDAVEDGCTYHGNCVTEGFTAVRQAGESISIQLLLDNGQVAYGDCAAVQYSGAGGRDPLFLSKQFLPVINKEIGGFLEGRSLDSFRQLALDMENFQYQGHRLHTAIRYGLSQALLDAVALARGVTRTEVVIDEYMLDTVIEPIPIFSQTGDERYLNADKIIIKRVDVMPHALINNVRNKLGTNGEKLLLYISWLKERIAKLAGDAYKPVFHIDVYGTIGEAFDNDLKRITEYFARLEETASPYKLRIEGPIDTGSKADIISRMRELRESLEDNNIQVEIVADEWCNTLQDIREFVDNRAADMVQIKTPDLGGIHNTIEAVLYCKEYGIGAYQGGTCNETDRSAQICTDIALATRPDQILAKPGMGVDEGHMIVYNEMQRVLALLKARHKVGV